MKDMVISADGKYVELSNEDVAAIMYTGIYSGAIHYWSDSVEAVGKQHGRNAEDDRERWVLTKEKLLKGITKYIEEPDMPYNILDEDEDGRIVLDTGMIDAVVADIIIQYALFGELRFS